jgi:hypothetical protein
MIQEESASVGDIAMHSGHVYACRDLRDAYFSVFVCVETVLVDRRSESLRKMQENELLGCNKPSSGDVNVLGFNSLRCVNYLDSFLRRILHGSTVLRKGRSQP